MQSTNMSLITQSRQTVLLTVLPYSSQSNRQVLLTCRPQRVFCTRINCAMWTTNICLTFSPCKTGTLHTPTRLCQQGEALGYINMHFRQYTTLTPRWSPKWIFLSPMQRIRSKSPSLRASSLNVVFLLFLDPFIFLCQRFPFWFLWCLLHSFVL